MQYNPNNNQPEKRHKKSLSKKKKTGIFMESKPTRQQNGCLKSCLTTLGGSGLFLFLLITSVIFVYVFLWAMGGVLIIADPLKEADAVVVLSGGKEERIEEGARLHREKYAEFYIITETGASIPELGANHVDLLKSEATTLGVPLGAFLITEEHADSTLEEARAVRQLLERNNLQSCIVVTDPYHTFRTRLIFRDVFEGSNIRIRVRPARNHWYQSTTWWMTQQGREMTFNEYVKIAYYMFGKLNNRQP